MYIDALLGLYGELYYRFSRHSESTQGSVGVLYGEESDSTKANKNKEDMVCIWIFFK